MNQINWIVPKRGLFVVGTFHSSLFGTQMKINIDPEVSREYAQRCVDHFNSLSESQINEFCRMAIAYCNFMREAWGDFSEIYGDIVDDIDRNIPKDISGRDIMRFISRMEMYIVEPPEQDVPAYSISGDCIWEPEHQLDWIIRGERTLYVGPCDGLGAWCDDDEYACPWNE